MDGRQLRQNQYNQNKMKSTYIRLHLTSNMQRNNSNKMMIDVPQKGNTLKNKLTL